MFLHQREDWWDSRKVSSQWKLDMIQSNIGWMMKQKISKGTGSEESKAESQQLFSIYLVFFIFSFSGMIRAVEVIKIYNGLGWVVEISISKFVVLKRHNGNGLPPVYPLLKNHRGFGKRHIESFLFFKKKNIYKCERIKIQRLLGSTPIKPNGRALSPISPYDDEREERKGRKKGKIKENERSR